MMLAGPGATRPWGGGRPTRRPDVSAAVELFCRIDRKNRIVGVGGDWDRFALENEGAAATAHRVLGTSLLDHVHGEATAAVLVGVLEAVRRHARPARLPFRCDSPSLKRWMEMVFTPEPSAGVLFSYRLLATAPIAAPLRFSATGTPQGRLLFRCSSCNRLRRDGVWREPEEVSALLDAHALAMPVGVSYGVCEDCRMQVARSLA